MQAPDLTSPWPGKMLGAMSESSRHPGAGRPLDDAAAKARAKPFRLIQAVCVCDAVVGMGLHFKADSLGVEGDVFGMPVLEFVGLALIAIGASGYVLFEMLARSAARRTGPPSPPLR